MTFLQWIFLLGAAAVIGPILAHLLGKPRFRRVPFTMLRFLRSGQSRRYSRRQLRDLLILLLRCAIIVLIAVLFAQPLLCVRAKPTRHRSVHWLALDDSMSMVYREGSETLFDRMVGTSLDTIRRAPQDATFGVCGLASGRSSQGLSKAQAMTEIKQLKPVPAAASFTELFSALKQAGKTASQHETLCLLLMTDFTPSVLQALERVSSPAVVDAVQYEHVAPRETVGNTAVLSARLSAAQGRKLNIDVTVCHWGSTERQCTLTGKSPDLRPVSIENVTLAPGQPRVLRMQMEFGPGQQRRGRGGAAGAGTGGSWLAPRFWGLDSAPVGPYAPIELSLTPDDHLSEDNTYRLAAYVPPAAARTNIVVVHRAEETFLFETALQALSNSGSLDGLNLKKVQEDRLTGSDLAGADIVVFASVPQHLNRHATALKAIVQQGGRLVFFMNDVPGSDAARQLWREGLLPALPGRWVAQTVYPEPRQAAGASLDIDGRAEKSLGNYGVDRIALKGYWQCEPGGRAVCLWRLAGGEPFIYGLTAGPGLSLLVNTSIDGSRGLLAKSPAWVAFCRYLVGKDDQARQFCFSADERPVLHVPEHPGWGPRTTISVENCDAGRGTASVQGSTVFMPSPTGIGWMKTIDEPVVYAGINLPAGETDVSPPAAEAIAGAVQRAFITNRHEDRVLAQADPLVRREPLWKYVAWAAILLLLCEAALANRLKR